MAATLPKEVFPHIFRYLTGVEVAQCNAVNRWWHATTITDIIWAALFRRDFIVLAPTLEPFIGLECTVFAQACKKPCWLNYRALYTQLSWNWWQFLRAMCKPGAPADGCCYGEAINGTGKMYKDGNLDLVSREACYRELEGNILHAVCSRTVVQEGLFMGLTPDGYMKTADEWARVMFLHVWKMPWATRNAMGIGRIVMGLCLSHTTWNIGNPDDQEEPTEEPGEFYQKQHWPHWQHLVQVAEDD